MRRIVYFISRLRKKLFGSSANTTNDKHGTHPVERKIETKFQGLIDDGNLCIGENSDIESVEIRIFGPRKGRVNITIGKDCLLHGTIVLYNPEAQVSIGDRVFIGPNTMLFCYHNIVVESDVMISWGCTLIDTNAHSLKSTERINDVLDWKKGWEYKDWSNVQSNQINVSSNSWIGFNSIITKGVDVGKGGIVASGSVVTKDVAPYTVVGGNPAKYIKTTT